MNHNTEFDISVCEYAEHLVDEAQEMAAAQEYNYTPIVITIKKLSIDMKDDYNGSIEIILSNGDKINYECRESRTPVEPGQGPPFYSTSFSINGNEILKDSEFWDQFAGTWVEGLMHLYEQYK